MKNLRRYLSIIRAIPKLTYKQDGLFTRHSISFMNESAFIDAYNAGVSTGSWGTMDIQWRVHTILWAATQALKVEGDFVECGTNRGGFARAIVSYLGFENLNRFFFLLDTFQGIDREVLSAEEKDKKLPSYTDCYQDVINTFSPYKNIRIIKGSVPSILAEVPSQKVAFLSIDMNNYIPEIAAINFFWPKMLKGGVVVLDDFAYEGYEEQNKAFTNWAEQNSVKILTLPTGQGLLIK